jgi:sulfur carrier protein
MTAAVKAKMKHMNETFSQPTPSESKCFTVQINGEVHTCPGPVLLPDLLEQLGLNLRLIAVEYNGEILHRQFWAKTQMQSGDRLEIVTIVGGG